MHKLFDFLKAENKCLHEREQKLKERERMVSISSQNIQTIAQHEIKQKLQAMEEVNYTRHVFQLKLSFMSETGICLNFVMCTCQKYFLMIFIFFQKYKADIFRLETLLREKTKENKRLKDNFETLKQANDALKKEVLVFMKIKV